MMVVVILFFLELPAYIFFGPELYVIQSIYRSPLYRKDKLMRSEVSA
jgi:hypothetical protein